MSGAGSGCARLIRQKALNPALPGLDDLLDQLRDAVVKSPDVGKNTYAGEIARQNERLLLGSLIQLATSKDADGSVRAVVHEALGQLRTYYGSATAAAHHDYHRWLIEQYRDSPDRVVGVPAQLPPDGAPIDPGQEWLTPECERQ